MYSRDVNNAKKAIEFIASIKEPILDNALLDVCKQTFYLTINEQSISLSKTDKALYFQLNYRHTGAYSPCERLNFHLSEKEGFKGLRYTDSFGDNTESVISLFKLDYLPMLIAETYEKDTRDWDIQPADVKSNFIIFNSHQEAEEAFYQKRYEWIEKRTYASMKIIVAHLDQLNDDEGLKLFKQLLQNQALSKFNSFLVNEQLLNTIQSDCGTSKSINF